MAERTPTKRRQKPGKPYPSFPLTAHNNGQWCKKIRGKIHFFGVWADPEGALEAYRRVAADLHAGRQPTSATLAVAGTSVKQVANTFLTFQQHRVDGREITPRWLEDCLRTVKHFCGHVGSGRLVSDLRPGDFQEYRRQLIAHGLSGRQGLGPYALERSITIVKAMFRYAYENDVLDRPVKYGRGFCRPSASVKRKVLRERQLSNGKKLLGPSDIRLLLAESAHRLRAMVLLGINGGFGNTDCSKLTTDAIDLEAGVIDFYRQKTGIERVVPLWPETVDALKVVLGKRPEASSEEFSKLVFLTKYGHPWVRQREHMTAGGKIKKVVVVNAVGQEFSKVLRSLGLKRKGLGFYALRHTFRTWADEARDQHATHRIMGHAIPGMSGVYVEEISLDRLRAVVDHVRAKLFGESERDGQADEVT